MVKYTPEQNGVTERMNMITMNKVRCMLISSCLAKGFWAEAASTAAHLINRSPSSSIGFKILQELWMGEPPNLSH